MDYKRSDRVADLIKQVIAELLQRRVKDPRLGKVTITGTEVSPDLKHAKIFYCYTGKAEERASIEAGLEKAKGFIRAQIGKQVRLKYLPELKFIYDSSFDYAAKIDQLLRELHEDE